MRLVNQTSVAFLSQVEHSYPIDICLLMNRRLDMHRHIPFTESKYNLIGVIIINSQLKSVLVLCYLF